jgi:16S rRNA (cytosine1402-N4)-methyltransferase
MHISVLKKEVVKYLDPKPNENFVDSTIGQAGHSLEILKKNAPDGKILGIEIDKQAYQELLKRRIKRLVLVNDSYLNLKSIVQTKRFQPVSGILFDLGFSSWHLERSGRGFSFKKNELLDMRYNTDLNKLTAEKILNNWTEKEIEKILKKHSQEKFAKRISRNIVEQRKSKPIRTTFELVEAIKRSVPPWYQHKRIHFATKTFQALRIAVNRELDNLKQALPQALEVLDKGGRLAVISFHSLEDRIVKNFLKDNSKSLRILTKKPIRPTRIEIINNPSSRSAKLRAAVKI